MIRNSQRSVLGRIFSLCLLCGLLLSCLSALCFSVTAVVRVPCVLRIDSISKTPVNYMGESMYLRTGYTLDIGEEIELSGWLATEEGVDYYEYAWVPASGGSPRWEEMDAETISERPDLTQAGIAYPTGHGSAGFELTIYPKSSMADGYYDLYVRAVTGGGNTCDVLVLVNLAYGSPDVDQNGIYSFSLSRLEREEGALTNSRIQDGALWLGENGVARLGDLNLALYESIRVTYSVPKRFTTEKQAVLGLKSSGEHPYGDGRGKYNMTDSLLYMPIETAKTAEPVTVELDLAAFKLMYSGEVYLCGYTGGDVVIHNVDLVQKGQNFTQTAAKLYLSEDSAAYMSGSNKLTLSGVSDPLFGDVLRFTVHEDTNDPYVFFNAEAMMADYEVGLNADQYRYMVILMRAAVHNTSHRFCMYLCSGVIMGATEECTYNIDMAEDGGWHYYLVDLSEKATWSGKIHGWRFDVLNGDSHAGDYVDVATVQFFRTVEAAQQAAQAPVTACESPYVKGQPALFKDMQEEHGGVGSDFEISPEDAFVVEPPETEAETIPTVTPEDTLAGEAVTLPSQAEESTLPSAEDTQPLDDGGDDRENTVDTDVDTVASDGETGGCSSAYGMLLIPLVPALAAVAVGFRRRDLEVE